MARSNILTLLLLPLSTPLFAQGFPLATSSNLEERRLDKEEELVVDYEEDLFDPPEDTAGATTSKNQGRGVRGNGRPAGKPDLDVPETCDYPEGSIVHDKDPEGCAALKFACDEDYELFYDDCGCGCLKKTTDGSDESEGTGPGRGQGRSTGGGARGVRGSSGGGDGRRAGK